MIKYSCNCCDYEQPLKLEQSSPVYLDHFLRWALKEGLLTQNNYEVLFIHVKYKVLLQKSGIKKRSV